MQRFISNTVFQNFKNFDIALNTYTSMYVMFIFSDILLNQEYWYWRAQYSSADIKHNRTYTYEHIIGNDL